MGKQRTLLRNLIIAYVSAFIIVILLAVSSQVIIHVALSQVMTSRQVSTSVTQRIIYSQRLQRNTVLLIGTEDRTEIDKELASDLAGIQISAAAFRQTYPDYAAEATAALPADATVQYHNVITAGTRLVHLEKQYAHASYQTRLKAEGPSIKLMFYSEIKQLGYLQKVQQIVDSSTDAYIARISLIEYFIFGLNLLVWLYELFVVLLPTTRRFAMELKALEHPQETEATAQETPTQQQSPFWKQTDVQPNTLRQP